MTRAARPAPPIAVQILGLLVGGLVAAQLATLVLSALLPPPPPPQYRIGDIAAALRGGPLHGRDMPPMERSTEARPPDARSPGWAVAEPSQQVLAATLRTDPGDVRLLFYSPPPFAGTGGRRADASTRRPRIVEASLFGPLLLAQLPALGPGGGGPGGGGPGGPGGGGPGGPGGGPGGGGAGQGPQGGRGRGGGGLGPGGANRAGAPSGGEGSAQRIDPPIAPVARGAPDGGPYGGPERGDSDLGRGGRAGEPTIARAPSPDGPIQTAPRMAAMGPGAPSALARQPAILPIQAPADIAGPPLGDALPSVTTARPAPADTSRARPLATPVAVAAADVPSLGATQPPAAVAPHDSRAQAVAQDRSAAQPLGPPVEHTLFGLARAPVVEGEFLAALRVAPGRWVTVRPLDRPLFSRWQRRLALWFVLAFAAVAPVGYLLARRLAAPLAELADTADKLGRDPSTPVALSSASPEIHRLAVALAGMQARLQRHVADRTAMVGAVSHDLRTPLARLRFKLERAPPALKASMLRDLGQMEEMLNAVLLFIRDASEPGARELADLRSIVECVVDDAALVGGDATLVPGEAAPVEVDILSVQRVLTNLVDNALKYGGSARISLSAVSGEAVVQVADSGPGLAEIEREKVFQPFYRSEAGRRASAQGMGLGLSVSRSIARAHGGDIGLRAGEPGLIAELRLPLASAAAPRLEGRDAYAPAA